MREDLRRMLVEGGASEQDLARAEAEGWLPLLALDCMLMPGVPTYGLREVAARAGLDETLARQLWRAVGFPDVPLGVRLFTEQDVEAARLLVGRTIEGDVTRAVLLRQVRVISASMARVAAVEADSIADVVAQLRHDGLGDDDIAVALLEAIHWDELARLIDYAHRMQLRAAAWRRLARDAEPDIAIGIGFADLAGYTELSTQLGPDQLADLLDRWEQVSYDTVAEHGARVVKTIGDEVMFAGLADQVASTALALRDAAGDRHGLPPVRAGLAAGPVIARDGDYYGPVVNLASRLTEIAPRGSILVPRSFRDELGDHRFDWRPAGTRELRSIGTIETYLLERGH